MEFVTFEIAKKLKEKGFPQVKQNTLAMYDELGEYYHLLTEDSLECDKTAIFKFKTYTHYLPIPKLEV